MYRSLNMCNLCRYARFSQAQSQMIVLICCSVLFTWLACVSTKFYSKIVRSQLIYCSQLWRLYLLMDIITLERIQRRATKFNLF